MGFSTPPLLPPGSRTLLSLGDFRSVREQNVFRRPRWFATLVALSLRSVSFREVLVIYRSVELEGASFVVRAGPAWSSSCPAP